MYSLVLSLFSLCVRCSINSLFNWIAQKQLHSRQAFADYYCFVTVVFFFCCWLLSSPLVHYIRCYCCCCCSLFTIFICSGTVPIMEQCQSMFTHFWWEKFHKLLLMLILYLCLCVPYEWLTDCISLTGFFRLNIDTISHKLRFNFERCSKVWIHFQCINETLPWFQFTM